MKIKKNQETVKTVLLILALAKAKIYFWNIIESEKIKLNSEYYKNSLKSFALNI